MDPTKVLPAKGTRIKLSGYTGTVHFAGEVDKTTGIWIGVEWDDPQRGRHNGMNDGKRYFTCRHPHGGSFIRPSGNISFGISFLEAIRSKYIEPPRGHDIPETVVLGSSQGAIVVEAAGLDKVREKLADLTRLREVSLCDEDVCRSDDEGMIRRACPNIRSLDLSTSLISSWDVVASITRELPMLQRLALKLSDSPPSFVYSYSCSRNRLQPPLGFDVMEFAFEHLTELLLNDTVTTWSEMQTIIAFMPNLSVIEMGYNSLKRLQSQDSVRAPLNNSVKTINLDSNFCFDWEDIWKSLEQYKKLQRLILSSNCIETIPFPSSGQGLPSLKYLSLSQNRISTWKDIDALESWCPVLESFSMVENPLTLRENTRHTRPFLISRIRSLTKLDGTLISGRERNDSELFYHSYILQHGPPTEQGRCEAHPQWVNLRSKYGNIDREVREKFADKLSHRMIAIKLYSNLNNITKSPDESTPLVLKILPSMTLRTLRMKLSKILKSSNATMLLWVRQNDGNLHELDFEHDREDLDRIGIQEGSDLIFRVVTE